MNNILDFLEQTANKYPQHTAVEDNNISYTWSELVKLSKCIGTGICEKTHTKNAVAIVMNKSAVSLATMLGVVYSGCFYVVVEPSLPIERIKNIFTVLKPKMIITDKQYLDTVNSIHYNVTKSLVSELMEEEPKEEKLACVRRNSWDKDLLYAIFTSGSTGVPKGIAVSHRAVIDFISHFKDIFSFSIYDRIANQAPFDFDVSVKDIYTSIMTGATLVLIPKEMFSTPPILLDYLCEKEVTSLTWAVSALSMVSALKGLSYKVPKKVKRILFSGEVMPLKQLRLWQNALPDAEFANLYGPTEITCNCTYYKIVKILCDGEKLPIGNAFPGREVFILNDNGEKIISQNIVGEICVSGESLSEGYYNNEEETNKRFIFSAKENRRYYKTGDLGYFGTNGYLYFSGRKDFQIKHMGHRIELEEIEQKIEQVEGVQRCCCIMDYKRNKIIAIFIGDSSSEKIKRNLKENLPNYMIPQKIIKSDIFPINKNGKTDRKYFQNALEEE